MVMIYRYHPRGSALEQELRGEVFWSPWQAGSSKCEQQILIGSVQRPRINRHSRDAEGDLM